MVLKSIRTPPATLKAKLVMHIRKLFWTRLPLRFWINTIMWCLGSNQSKDER